MLFIVYIFIEIIEIKTANKLKYNKLLNNKFSPVIASAVGVIPQCGFSVIATDLYAEKRISLASLLAVYVATSDEAIPILISNPSKISYLLPLIIIKLIFGILVGYGTMVFLKYMKKREVIVKDVIFDASADNIVYEAANSNSVALQNINNLKVENQVEMIEVDVNLKLKKNCEAGCCNHNIGRKPNTFNKFILHPLIHSSKIFVFILIVNIIFGILLHFVGIDRLSEILLANNIFQPFIVALIGLIPNCAASVIITELFIVGGISFGGCIAGLTVNTGIALAVLYKSNKNLKNNLLITLTMYLLGSLLGVLLIAVM